MGEQTSCLEKVLENRRFEPLREKDVQFNVGFFIPNRRKADTHNMVVIRADMTDDSPCRLASKQIEFSVTTKVEATLEKQMLQKLDKMFNPNIIAIIGASNSIQKWGGFLTVHMLKGKFIGKIYPVNPREKQILGMPAYRSILDIPEPIDLGIIAVPADKVLPAIEEAGKKGVPGLVVVTSGFSETGEDGKSLEKQMVEIAKRFGIRIIGPNTMGITSTYVSLYATGAAVFPPRGHISFISQSGNLGTQMLYWAEREKIGIDQFFGTGNEADISAFELLEYLAERETTRVILLYLEGIDDGRKLFNVLKCVTRKKPVLVLKAGRTKAGARAALSHTGAIAGKAEVFEAALKQAGCIIVKNPSDLLDIAIAFSYLPLPKGNRIGVCTLGGGWGVVASDLLNEAGFELPPLDPQTIARFDKILPPYWSRSNPVDLVGQVDEDIFNTSLHTLLETDYIDALIMMGVFGVSEFVIRVASASLGVAPDVTENEFKQIEDYANSTEHKFREETLAAMEKFKKPVIGVLLSSTANLVHEVDGKTLILFPTPERAIKALQALYQYQQYLSRQKT